MSAVEITDVYRYGTRFVGALLAVVVVAGAFLGIGYVLVQNGQLGSFSGSDGYRAVLGIVVGALGVLLGLSGVFGLAHKLIADATEVGTAAAIASEPIAARSAETGTPADEDVETSDSRGASVEQSDRAEEQSDSTRETPVESSETTDPDTTTQSEESTTSDVQGPPSQTPSVTASSERAETGQREEPAATDREPGREQQESASQTSNDHTTATTPSRETPESSTETVTVDDLQRDDEPSAETEADWTAEKDADSEPSSAVDEGATEVPDSEPKEWTPPDPSEFEPKAGNRDEESDVPQASEEIDRAEDTGPRTTDDLFGTNELDDDIVMDEPIEGQPREEAVSDESDEEKSVGDGKGFESSSDADPLSDALEDE